MNQKTLTEQGAETHKGKFAGDAILQNQKMHEAHTHVNADWLSKTLTFESMLKKAQEFQALCTDMEGLNLSDLMSDGGQLSEEVSGKLFNLTEHSTQQLGMYSGVPGSYLQKLSGEYNDVKLFDDNVNAGIKRVTAEKDRAVFLRTVEKNGVKTLRAILSGRYAVINNLPIIETLGDIIPGGRVSHLHYDGDTFRANILIPDAIRKESDSDYGGGVSVLNNETGRFVYKSRPFVFRAICWNGNIWDELKGEEFSKKHMGTIDWAEFRKNIILNIQRQIPLAQEGINRVLALKGVPVTQQQIEQAIVYLGRQEKLSKSAMTGWYEGFQVELQAANTVKEIFNAFGIVQGLTRAAQTQEEFKIQELMETLSGKLIDSNWDRLLTAATNSVTPEEANLVLVGQKD